jgi:hypothetical protein
MICEVLVTEWAQQEAQANHDWWAEYRSAPQRLRGNFSALWEINRCADYGRHVSQPAEWSDDDVRSDDGSPDGSHYRVHGRDDDGPGEVQPAGGAAVNPARCIRRCGRKHDDYKCYNQ